MITWRFVLFLITNFAVLIVMSLVLGLLEVLGVVDLSTDTVFSVLVVGLVWGMTGAFVSLALSKWAALRLTKAKAIRAPANPDEAWLKSTVERLAGQAGIGMPDVAIYPSDEINAFSTGMYRDHALVAVSSRLMRDMNRQQLQAVIGHEVSHIANGDMVTMTLLTGVLNAFIYFFSWLVSRGLGAVLNRVGRSIGAAIIVFLVVIFLQSALGILATLIVMAHCRRRELRADAGGAKLVGRNAMIDALKRLGTLEEGDAAGNKGTLPKPLQAFGVHDHSAEGANRWFLSHPPLEERIAALQNFKQDL